MSVCYVAFSLFCIKFPVMIKKKELSVCIVTTTGFQFMPIIKAFFNKANIFTDGFEGGPSFVDHLCYLCLGRYFKY